MNAAADEAQRGIAERAQHVLGRRVVWLTDERRDSSGAESRTLALVVIIGREHYTERRKQYPILSRNDLDAVLKQELQGSPPTLTLVSPGRDDRREVAFFELKPGVLERAGRAIWLVPESVVLAGTLPSGRVATVDRQGFRYFVASNGVSQPEGGAVATADLFALAAGLDASDGLVVTGEDLRTRLWAGLRNLPWDAWMRLRAPTRTVSLGIDWQPLAWMAGVGLVAYMALASGYLAITRDAREKEVAGLGGEVDKLLVAQREVDRMLAEQTGLAAVLADRRSSYRLWQPVALAWSTGAAITGIQLKDATVTLRGNAAVATDVLAAVDGLSGFADAKFSAPVRRNSSGREEFSLELTMLQEPDRG
jgi:hypothetical protein